MRRAAVVIGCSNYRDPQIGALRFAHRDAESVAGALTAFCGVGRDDLALCTSAGLGARSADRSAIAAALLGLSSRPADVVFFFFSGHGFRSPDDGRDYLLPHDALYGDLRYTAIALDDVTSRLAKCNARCAVLILDACRTFTRGGKPVGIESLAPIDPQGLAVNGLAAFFSCRPSERSYEADTLGGSVFTAALLEALGDDGRCRTVRELDAYLARRAPELSLAHDRPLQRPLARVEPLEMANVAIVSRDRLVELGSKLRLGRERRRAPPPAAPPSSAPLNTSLAALDIGSSNSLCAFPAADGELRIIPGPGGRRHVPSAVLVRPDMDYEIGQAAIDGAGASDGVLLRNFKRLVPTGGALGAHGRDIAATDLVTATVASIVRNAEETLGAKVCEVLAAVPAGFGFRARDEFAGAIARAGVDLVRLISEPCAAAVCGFHDALDRRDRPPAQALHMRVVVIDIGGGTTDVAVVEIAEVDGSVQFEVLSVTGDPSTAGIDFDVALHALIRQRMTALARGADVAIDLDAERQLRAEAERVKVRLGAADHASVVLSNLESAAGLRDLEIVVSRADLVAATADLVERIESCIEAAVGASHDVETPDRGWGAVDAIMLAGMGSKIWPVRQLIDRLAQGREVIARHEESAVVTGLARYAAVLREPFGRGWRELLLIDALPSSVYIDCERRAESGGSIDGDSPPCVLSSSAGMNTSPVRILSAFSLFPVAGSCTLELGGPAQRHTLVVYEADRDGRRVDLARIAIDAAGDRRKVTLKLDVDENSTLQLTLDGPSREERRVILLCGAHTASGRARID
ncbi:MAG: Hsp70 family protein, partial [Burkholderiaceae bacterium]